MELFFLHTSLRKGNATYHHHALTPENYETNVKNTKKGMTETILLDNYNLQWFYKGEFSAEKFIGCLNPLDGRLFQGRGMCWHFQEEI